MRLHQTKHRNMSRYLRLMLVAMAGIGHSTVQKSEAVEPLYRVDWAEFTSLASLPPHSNTLRGLEYTSDGSLYAAGHVNRGQWDAYLARYSAEGEELWLREFGSNGDDYASDVAADNQGGIYVVGALNGVELNDPFLRQTDWYLARYSATGDLLSLVNDRGGDSDQATGVVAGLDGSAYLIGVSDVIDEQGVWPEVSTEGFIKKISTSGDVLWSEAIGFAPDVIPVDVALAPEGGVFMAGYTAGAFEGSLGRRLDGFIAKYSPDGEELWAQVIGSDRRDRVKSLAIDDEGAIYVAGTRSDTGESENDSNEAFLAKFNSLGEQLWDRQLVINAGEANLGNSVAIDADGNVLLAGTTAIGLPWHSGFLAKYSANGELIGLNYADTLFYRADGFHELAVDSEGSVFVAGESTPNSLAGFLEESHLTKFVPISTFGYLPGDFNDDGVVDAADYSLWRDAVVSGDLTADADGDGLVYTQDYNIWNYHYGTVETDAATVPEPVALLLTLLSVLGVDHRRC